MCSVITDSETWTLLKADIAKLEVFHMMNQRHPLVWICHERGSHHPLTSAVHKWSYKSEETLSLWLGQKYGSGFSCTRSPTPLIHVTTGLRTVWHLEKTTRLSTKTLGGAGQHEHRVLSFWCLECCNGSVIMEDATTPRRSSVERTHGSVVEITIM